MTEKCNKLGFLKTINNKNDSKRDKIQCKQACEFNVNLMTTFETVKKRISVS